jgi:hypothetical protein
MDINCGSIIDGQATLQEMGQSIFDLLLRTASGQKSKSEIVGMGENEFAPWQIGVLARRLSAAPGRVTSWLNSLALWSGFSVPPAWTRTRPKRWPRR